MSLEIIKLEENSGNVVRFKLSGRLDTLTSAQLQDQLMGALDSYPSASFVLDFDQLTYVSSTGLRVLLMARKKAASQSRYITLTHVPDSIKNILKISGFLSYFEIV